MTAAFLGINAANLEGNLGNVTNATTAPTADFYFQMASQTALTRKQAILALEMFIRYIESNGVPAGHAGTNLPLL